MALTDDSNNFIKHAIKKAIVSDLIQERIEAYKTELETLKKSEHNADCPFSVNPDEIENCTCLAKAQDKAPSFPVLSPDKDDEERMKVSHDERGRPVSTGRFSNQSHSLKPSSKKSSVAKAQDTAPSSSLAEKTSNALNRRTVTGRRANTRPEGISWAQSRPASAKKDYTKTQGKVFGKAEPLSKPPVSEAQRAAMGAAASGNSTLDIPKKVGKEFINADKGGKLPVKKALPEWITHNDKEKKKTDALVEDNVKQTRENRKKFQEGKKLPLGKQLITPPAASADEGQSMQMGEDSKSKIGKGEDYDNNEVKTVMSRIDGKVPNQGKKINPKPVPNGKIVPKKGPNDHQEASVVKGGKSLPVKKADPMFLSDDKKEVKKAMGGVTPPKAVPPKMPQPPKVGPSGAGGQMGLGKAAISPEHKKQMQGQALDDASRAAAQVPAAPAPAPKMPAPAEHEQRAAGFNDFMPKGKFTKDELGKCAMCNSEEHLGKCSVGGV